MHKVSFDVTKDERELCLQIMQRAAALIEKDGGQVDRLGLHMDLVACHANGCPLRLQDLLAADDFNLAHDVFGISRHIDRTTGQLQNFFLPRFSAPSEPKVRITSITSGGKTVEPPDTPENRIKVGGTRQRLDQGR